MSRDSAELWQRALDDAQSVRDSLVMAQQLASVDRDAAIGCASQALERVAALRASATMSSALLGAVLFHGIELEVRLGGIRDIPPSNLATALSDLVSRCDRLIAAIEVHLDDD